MNDELKKKALKAEAYPCLKKYLPWENYLAVTEWLNKIGFWEAPASTKYHGAYPCGLAEHSLVVMENLVLLTKKMDLKWKHERSPYLIGLLHDVCKTDQYKYNEEAHQYEYRNDSIFSHHGEKSICMLASCITLTEEEIACIRWHMGAYETDTNEWKYYGNAIKKFPNVLWTHTADMMASHIDGV